MFILRSQSGKVSLGPASVKVDLLPLQILTCGYQMLLTNKSHVLSWIFSAWNLSPKDLSYLTLDTTGAFWSDVMARPHHKRFLSDDVPWFT